MAQGLYIVAVDLGGYTAPMLVPYYDTRCPESGADVDHLAIDPGLELVPDPSDEDEEPTGDDEELELAPAVDPAAE